MLWPKKNSYKEFNDEKKNSCGLKIPTPHNFCNGPSLIEPIQERALCSLGYGAPFVKKMI